MEEKKLIEIEDEDEENPIQSDNEINWQEETEN